MQQRRKFQLKHRSKFSQLILLDDQANIVSSCNSVFDTEPFLGQAVTSWFPFLESIFSDVWNIQASTDGNIFFSKIETPIPELPGIYDFTFSKVNIDDNELLLWAIYDYTDLYEDFKQFQQRKNELEIHRETLERRYHALQQEEDITDQQNIIIENLDHLQLTYFSKIKSALITPINVLDGLTFFLTNSKETNEKPYLKQLKSTLKQLNDILEELEEIDQPNLYHDESQPFFMKMLEKDIVNQFDNQNIKINFAEPATQKPIYGIYHYLRQVVFGILNNAIQLHPQSIFELTGQSTPSSATQKLKLHLQIKEYLHSKATFHTEEAYTSMIYRLSIIKQIIDLQRGSIQVDKNPKELSISIHLHMEYDLLPPGDK